jgi:hypothetical protein
MANLPTYTQRFGFGQAFSNAYNKEKDRQFQMSENLKDRSMQQDQFNKNFGFREKVYDDITKPEADRRTEIYERDKKYNKDLALLMKRRMAKQNEVDFYNEQLEEIKEGSMFTPDKRNQLFNPLTYTFGTGKSLFDLLGGTYEEDLIKNLTIPVEVPLPNTLDPRLIQYYQNTTPYNTSSDDELYQSLYFDVAPSLMQNQKIYNPMSTGGNMLDGGFTIPR